MKRLKDKLRDYWNTTAFPISKHSEIPHAKEWTKQQQSLAFAIIAFASLVVLLPNLSYPLIEPDETRYAQIAINMLDSGDWITPTLDGKAYLDKPPLMYWLTAIGFRLFGENSAAARLPAVISAWATIMLVFLLGKRLVGSRAACFGAVSLLLCGGFVLAGRFLILDSLLAMLTTLCLLSGYIAIRETDRPQAWWMISAAACALGVLSKGPVALVLCVPPLIVSGWLKKDQTRTTLLRWIVFSIPILLVCVPWYIAVWKLNPEFGDYFFWEHNIKRFTEGSNHRQPFWFYLPILFAGMFPTSLLLPSLAVFLVKRSPLEASGRSRDLGFLFCGSVWIVAFFSIASCKLPTYILPSLPLIALMIGAMIDHTVFKPQLPSRLTTYLKPFPQRVSLILLGSGMALIGIDVWFAGDWKPLSVFALLVVVCLLPVLFWAWNREFAFAGRGWALTTGIGMMVLCFGAGEMMPTIANSRSLYCKTRIVAQQHPTCPIVFYGESPDAAKLQLPAERVIYFGLGNRSEFINFLKCVDEAIVVTPCETIRSTLQAIDATDPLDQTQSHEQLFVAHHNAVLLTRRSKSLAVRATTRWK